jgi:negative regulator of flagellin synthesis FlgM
MPSFELNRLQSIAGVSAAAGAERARTRPASDAAPPRVGDAPAGIVDGNGVAVEIGTQVAAGPPVDADRVAEIRDALRDGTYPLVPTKIADAMIAAQLGFGIRS